VKGGEDRELGVGLDLGERGMPESGHDSAC
jgi:hypothetical protein